MDPIQIFKGIFTAIVTPFKKDLIDFENLAELLERQINNKIDGIVIADPTGEGYSLSQNEYYKLIDCTISTINDRIPLVVNIPHCSTAVVTEMIALLKVGASRHS